MILKTLNLSEIFVLPSNSARIYDLILLLGYYLCGSLLLIIKQYYICNIDIAFIQHFYRQEIIIK